MLLLLQGYFLASFMFLAIVFSLPICLGLAALALNLPVSSSHLFNFISFLHFRLRPSQQHSAFLHAD